MCSGGEERGVGAASLGKEKEGVRLEGEDEEQEKRTSKARCFPIKWTSWEIKHGQPTHETRSGTGPTQEGETCA